MNATPIGHGTFTLERHYPVSCAKVFAAWASAEAKARWFIGPEGWNCVRREVDFTPGGTEVLVGRFASGRETRFTARFHAIEPDSRLVFVYDMHLNEVHHSVSLATVELATDGEQTRLTFTEQVAFLDGTRAEDGTAARERGTALHLDRLWTALSYS
jgi:uncharacterized protein YndB with AHSA1/START domain